MSASGTKKLWAELRPGLGQAVTQFDFFGGLVGAALGASLATRNPDALGSVGGVAAGFVGVVIGAVLAGASVQAAFMDQEFMRKLQDIGRRPATYLTPFLFTAVLGVLAMLTLVPLVALQAGTPCWILTVLGGLGGLFTIWSIASVLPCLAMLVQFIDLKCVAAGVPDRPPDEGDATPGS